MCLAAPPAGASVSASTIQFAAPNLKTPYSAQGNITVERQLTPDILLSVSGIFSRGIHLMGATDVNAPQPTTTYTYTIDNSSGQQTGTFTTPIYLSPRPNTKYGTVYEDNNGVDSVYDGLAVTVNKRFTHGIQMLGSYTWSHEIDDGQEQASNAIFFSTITTLYNNNNSAERASGWEDQRHRFVYSFVWSPTLIHSGNAFAKYLLNDWQLFVHHHAGLGPSLWESHHKRKFRADPPDRRELADYLVYRRLHWQFARAVSAGEQHPDSGILPCRRSHHQVHSNQGR